MKKHRIFSTLIESQKKSYELIMTSVLIAIGVNLLSTGIVELLGIQNKGIILIVIGMFISIGVVVRISTSKINELNQMTKINGFVIYDEESHKLIGVPEYGISTDMVEYLDCAFAENKALEKLWNNESISQFRIVGGKPGEQAIGVATHSGALFIELLEYCIIHKLSLHLSEFFNNSDDKKCVREFQRNDIPEVLLSNRFLKLFSEDMANREIFAYHDAPLGNNKDTGTIVYARNSSGGYYDRFDLTLPERSTISRKNKNEIVIETPILTLTVSCLFGGFRTILKSGFYRYYLGIAIPKKSYRNYGFNVEVNVKFKIKSLFSKEKEVYYAWIDSFLDELSSYIGKDDFFARIDWDSVYTMLRCNNNANKLASLPKEVAKPKEQGETSYIIEKNI